MSQEFLPRQIDRGCLLLAGIFLFEIAAAHGAESWIVHGGRGEAIRYDGEPWSAEDGWIESHAQGVQAAAALELGQADATVRARLRIDGLAESDASFFLGESQFIFAGRIQGPIFGDYPRQPTRPFVADGKVFDFEVRRQGQQLTFWVDDRQVWETPIYRNGALEDFGFRADKATVRIYEWSAEGSLVQPPPLRSPPLLVDVFQSGPDGVSMYRIPAVATTKQGTLLAFAEARRNALRVEIADSDNIDLVLRRSEDGGETWGPEQVVWDDGRNTCGNPCVVVDQRTGRIWLAMCWNLGSDHEDSLLAGKNEQPRRVYITYSDDDGRTWAKPRDITASVKRSDWRWYATGPGTAIQLTRGSHAGRIVIPANHSDHAHRIPPEFIDMEHPYYRSHVFYSDDGGENWQLGGAMGWATNESTIVELADGAIFDNVRSYAGRGLRAVSISRDGGDTWSTDRLHPDLIEPKCQGSMLRYSFPSATEKSRILFSNPASPRSRNRLTVRVSYDEGETWPVSAMIYRGSSAYSCLTMLADGSIGLFFERDDTSKMSFTKFTIDWLEGN